MAKEPVLSQSPQDDASGLAAGHAARGDGFEPFLRLLLANSDTEVLAGLPPDGLALEGRKAFAALAERPAGHHHVVVRESAVRKGGLVLEIVNDDMPFLLDSVLAEVQARGLEVALVLHPIFKVDRDATGRLIAVAGTGDGHWDDGRQESYITVHLPAMTGPRRDELAAAVSSILDEVRIVVGDWKPMLARLAEANAALAHAPSSVPPSVRDEQRAFLAWLSAGHFTLLGMRDYRLDGPPETGELVSDDAAGLGLLRDPTVHVLRRGGELVVLTPEVRQFFFAADPVIITKANVVARVHRRVHMDYVGIKHYAPDGAVAGELRLVGLFTSQAYTQSPRRIPVLRRKLDEMTARLDLPPESHAGKALVNVLEAFPRDELFQIGADDLERWLTAILDLDLRPRTRVLLRHDRFDRFVSALVFVQRDRFSTGVRERIAAYLAETFEGYIAAFYPHFTDGPLARVHFIIARRSGEMPRVAPADLEQGIGRLVRTWSDDLADELRRQSGDTATLVHRYADAFPAGYAELFPPARALEDIQRIERLGDGQRAAIDMHTASDLAPSRVRAAIYCLDEPIRLSVRVPMLESLGFAVIDERTLRLQPRLGGRPRPVLLHDMELETTDGRPLMLGPALDRRLEEAFIAILDGHAECDGFNRLVLAADLTWREAAILRSYAAYLRQLGSAFGPRYIAETLLDHAGLVRDLVELFHARFDPDRAVPPEGRATLTEPIAARIATALAEVESLDEDRILRLVLALIEATVRTNFYLAPADGPFPATIAFKLDGHRLTMAPAPRPFAEIFVASPRVEGVHLRFAPIARGGIRWSDRAQDYRTEVLGLARAQQVKNAVIVPAGAKGGFLPKALPRNAAREAVQQEGIAAYSIFIGAMLDLTDTIVDGRVVPPARVVRHDGDDPYLVVAADKGTATFSDTANAIALARGFWLGDAFASGGSAGYDHKGLGITARGAWECVKRHFHELDRDIQTDTFRVAGVGDMSGDVFGNGMLLSPATRLVAAFDHRHIFLDPTPDPATSLAERCRLFALPRSSWADYDPKLISKGGGVHARTAKSITLTPEVRAMLGLEAATLTPAELMRAILTADVDLLWFGGIGTYIRASTETDADAGDRANDQIRITAADVRAKVIGEGANLGMTQRARIEAAGRSIRLNTDFIDNSAGVNTSDQEVNIKIALLPGVASGRLAIEERNGLLAAHAADVSRAVLRNNYQQSLALSLAERRQGRDLGAIARLVRDLDRRGLVDRRLEALPGDHELAERARTGRGLTRPELATVLSFAKIALSHDLLASTVPDDSYLAALAVDYFPPGLQERFAADIAAHRLRREIVATTLTNGLVNRLGPATPLALADATGRPVTDTAFAFMAARGMLGLPELWQRIDALDGRVTGEVQLGIYERVRQALVAAAEDLLRDGIAREPLATSIPRLAAACREIRQGLATIAPAGLRDGLAEDRQKLVAARVPDDLALDLALIDVLAMTPAIAATSAKAGVSIGDAARTYLALGSELRIEAIMTRAGAMVASDDYERLAVSGSTAGLKDAHRRLALAFLRRRASPDADAAAWLRGLGVFAERATKDLDAIAGMAQMSIARLTVAAARLAGLAQSAEAGGG